MMNKSTKETITYSKTERIKIYNIHTDSPIDTSKRDAAKTAKSQKSAKSMQSATKNFAPLRLCEQIETA